jgi:hypothetical protein
VIIGATTVIFNLLLGWLLTQSGSISTRLSTITTVFSVANIIEATLLIGWLCYHHRAIIPIQQPFTWCIGIGGMMVLLQLAYLIPPFQNSHSFTSSDMTALLVNLLFYAGCLVWGIGWCSQGFGFVRTRLVAHA